MSFPRTKDELEGWLAGMRDSCETHHQHVILDCMEEVARRIAKVPDRDPAFANMMGKISSLHKDWHRARAEVAQETMAELRAKTRRDDSRTRRLGLH